MCIRDRCVCVCVCVCWLSDGWREVKNGSKVRTPLFSLSAFDSYYYSCCLATGYARSAATTTTTVADSLKHGTTKVPLTNCLLWVKQFIFQL